MDERRNVLEVLCREPDGEVVRSVKLCHLTVEKLKHFWEKLSAFDVLFNDFVRGDLEAFINHFVLQVDGEPVPAGLIWEVDDVGIFLLNEIRPEHSGKAHFVFWDRRFTGRVELCQKMIEYVLKTYQLEKITVEVPVHANHTLRAVEKIGLVREGRLRKEVLYKGKWFDVIRYSILKGEEFLPSRNSIEQICLDCGKLYSGDVNGTEC